ncbi:DUF624 domain-containing protein [Micromonospora sp. WMMD882]|uniref:DUF624 domain-containing protein n=1 Tax=Micromonospora sp. WMMD882 TaxID=3015151 RepID=UPI00248AB9F0|nr:DUF624 domain-containing protein [Micromonospora sp. WMMD882]WBB80587.1 DUF624 domain-containing protein [Micromonospora sp. WMMD882]
MSDTARAGRQVGDGPLARGAATVHILLVVELMLLLTTAPGLVGLVLLDRDRSNLPLAALCLTPLGPAVAAALHTLRHQRPDLTDLRPAAVFRRAWRANLGPVSRIWLPLLLWLTVVAVNLAHRAAVGLPGWWSALLVVVAVTALLAGVNALVITTCFTFRTRDVARLAAYFLIRRPGVTIGHAALLALAAGVVAVGSEAVLALLGAVFVALLHRTSRPMIDTIEKEFTA